MTYIQIKLMVIEYMSFLKFLFIISKSNKSVCIHVHVLVKEILSQNHIIMEYLG